MNNLARKLAINTSLLALKINMENKKSIAFSNYESNSYIRYDSPKFTKFENGKIVEITEYEFKNILRTIPHSAEAIIDLREVKPKVSNFRSLEYKYKRR